MLSCCGGIISKSKRWIRVVLLLCMSGNIVGIILDYVLLYDGTTADKSLLVPTILATNLVATLVVGAQAWLYRRDMTSLMERRSRTSGAESVLLLVLESGCVYCGGLTIYLAVSLTIPEVADILTVAIDFYSAIYATSVILIVTTRKSDVVRESLVDTHSSEPLAFAAPQRREAADVLLDSLRTSSDSIRVVPGTPLSGDMHPGREDMALQPGPSLRSPTIMG